MGGIYISNYLLNSDDFISKMESLSPKKSLIIALEHLNTILIDSILNKIYSYLNSNDNKIDIYILIKNDITCFSNGLSDIRNLEKIKRLSKENIIIKGNSNLTMSGFVIDNNILVTNLRNDDKFMVWSFCDDICEIESFENVFFNLFNAGETLDMFYEDIIKKYILSTLDIDSKLKSYINFIKSDNHIYQSSCFYSAFNSAVKLSASEVPQYSNFDNGTHNLVSILSKLDNTGYTFLEIGKLLQEAGKKDGAYTKYGENHSKLGESLGLIYIDKVSRIKKVYLSDIGKQFIELSYTEKKYFLRYQIHNIPLIKYIFNICFDNTLDIEQFLVDISQLSISTAKRRSSNITNLITYLCSDSSDVASIFSNCLKNKHLGSISTNKYIYTNEEKNILKNIIQNKLKEDHDFVHIDGIYRSIKMYAYTLFKVNNINTPDDLFKLLSTIFRNDMYYFKYPLISSSNHEIDIFINYAINKKMVNRNDFFEYFSKLGFRNNTLSQEFNRVKSSILLRINFDNYIHRDIFNISHSYLYEIKRVLKSRIDQNSYISLYNYDFFDNLPDLDYPWTSYLLESIVSEYMTKDFRIISKYSDLTYKFKYLCIVNSDSSINDFTDIVIDVLKKRYSDYSSVNIADVEDYLVVNGIINNSLYLSLLDYTKLHVDDSNRISII